MRSYRELADRVFERRDNYLVARKRKRKRIIKRVSATSCALFVALGAGVLLRHIVNQDTVPSDNSTVYSQTNPHHDASNNSNPFIEVPTTTTTTTTTTTKTTAQRTTISSEGFPDESVWNKNTDGWYTSRNGGIQIYTPDWQILEMFGWTYLAPYDRYEIKSGADWQPAIYYQNITIGFEAAGPYSNEPVLGFDPYRTFTAAEKHKFNTDSAWNITGMYVTYDYFEKTTISSMGKTYTCYRYSYEGVHYWHFQTDYYIYSLSFKPTNRPQEYYPHDDMKALGEEIMSNIRIYY